EDPLHPRILQLAGAHASPRTLGEGAPLSIEPPPWGEGRTVVNLFGQGLLTDSYTAKREPRHLASSRYYSVLGVPLTDRKGHTLGWLVWENRLGAGGA